ncbi:F-box domain containing protein, partial [Tanacetum coccineum]
SSKKMENMIDTTDRISTLPDFIVHHILSYLLDDYESRVRMSVLSKKWFALTTSFPLLYFHLDLHWPWPYPEFDNDSLYRVEMFYRYLEYTVSRFCDQNDVSAHTLDFFANFVDLGQIQLFGRCLELVVEKDLQVLVIDVEYWDENLPMFRLPNTLLSASSLTSLTLISCKLPSPLMVGVVQLKSLRLLSLSYLPIDEGVIEHLTKGCPLLEEMYITYCYGLRTFCVKSHHNLQKVEIYRHSDYILDRIDVDAPNLKYFLLDHGIDDFKKKDYDTDKATCMSLGSCKKLTTFYYRGLPSKKFSDLLSNFPFIENLLLHLSSPVDNLKLSHHFLKILELHWYCSLEEIDLYAPNLLLFEYDYNPNVFPGFLAMSRIDSSLAKGCMKCYTDKDFDILWFQRLRRFLDKNRIFKVLELDMYLRLIDVEELKLIQLPPYEIAHVKLKHRYSIKESLVFVALVDAVLWCLRPRSLTFQGDHVSDIGDIIEYTYQKLLQQEDEGQTNIKFVLISSSKGEQHFSDLSSLLKALPLDESTSKITFIKEEVVHEALQEACSRVVRLDPELEQRLYSP